MQAAAIGTSIVATLRRGEGRRPRSWLSSAREIGRNNNGMCVFVCGGWRHWTLRRNDVVHGGASDLKKR